VGVQQSHARYHHRLLEREVKASLLSDNCVAALSSVLITWFGNSAPRKAPCLVLGQN
jgi:hypothetical protein